MCHVHIRYDPLLFHLEITLHHMWRWNRKHSTLLHGCMPIFEIYVQGIHLHLVFSYLCGCTWFTNTNKEWISRKDFKNVALFAPNKTHRTDSQKSNSIIIIVKDALINVWPEWSHKLAPPNCAIKLQRKLEWSIYVDRTIQPNHKGPRN